MVQQAHSSVMDSNHVIDPTTKQLFCVTWSVVWRYALISLLIILPLYALYVWEVGIVVSIVHFIQGVWALVGSAGFIAALKMYPLEIFLWFLVRVIVGVIITYWVFARINRLNYGDFYLDIKELSGVSCHSKDILQVAWSFYWRLAVIMILVFIISTFFVDHAIFYENMPYMATFYLVVAVFVMPIIFRMIINRPLGSVMLQVKEQK